MQNTVKEPKEGQLMTNLMRRISEAMSKVDTKQVLAGLAKSAPAPGEKVVGTASKELLQLWGVVQQVAEEIAQLEKRMLYMMAELEPSAENFKEKFQPILTDGSAVFNRSKAAHRLFWASVHADFPETLTADTGIRCGGQIVTSERDAHVAVIDVADLISRLRL